MNQTTDIIEQAPAVPGSTDTEVQTQVSQIAFQDTTTQVVAESKNQLEKLYGQSNPFPDDTPLSVLTKVVKIETLTWSSASSGWQLNPLANMLSVSKQLNQLLGDLATTYGMYRYLRCGFKITIKLNSTPYHQGCLIASWIPPGKNPANDLQNEMAAGNHGVILSASAQDQCEFTIPYINFDPWWDLIRYDQLRAGPILLISILNPLLTSNGAVSDSVPITIWMQLDKPEVAGPLPTGFTYGSTTTSTTTVTGTVLSREKPELIYHNQSSKHDAKTHVAKEAQAKEDKGLSLIKGAVDAVYPVVKKIPLVGEALEIGAAILGSLDKPTSDATVMMTVPRTWRSLHTLKGLDYPEPLGSYIVQPVTKDVGLISSDMSVTQYAQLPNWYQSATVSTAGVVYNITVHPMRYYNFSSGGRANPDFLAFAASTYSYWRGSIKYLFQFVGTAFYSCSFRISVYYGPLLNSPHITAIADGVPLYSKVITVRGDAWCEIEVPYLRKRSWEFTKLLPSLTPGDQQQCNPFILVEALTNVQGSSSPNTAVYYVNVYRAGGSDIQFSQLTASVNTGFLDETGIEYENQCTLIDKFNKPFEPLLPGCTGLTEENVCMSDNSGSITDCCKRPCIQYNYTNSGTPTGLSRYQSFPWSDDSTNGYRYQPMYWWAQTFAYWRGAMRVYGPLLTDRCAALSSVQNTGIKAGSGVAYFSTAAYIHVEVPYYCRASFVPTYACDSISSLLTYYDLPSTVAFSSWTGSTATVWVAFGDDAVLLHPVSPSPFAFAERTPKSKFPRRPEQLAKIIDKTSTGISLGVTN